MSAAQSNHDDHPVVREKTLSDIHKFLKRQLRRFNVDDTVVDKHSAFFQSISDAYTEHDQEIELLERSMYLVSNELNERNKLLKDQLLELTKTENQLQESISVLGATFDATGENIVVYDVSGNLATINSMGQTFFARHGVQDYQNWSALLSVFKFPNQALKVKNKLFDDPMQQLNGVLELTNNCFYEYRSLPQVIDNTLIGRVWCFRDVTQQKESEEMVQHQAYHDALTGLPNRSLLLDRVEHASAIARRMDTQLAVLFVDLDNFKRVNDTEGHKAGDELLVQLVTRFQSNLREQDTLARLGGDEFVLLLESVKGKDLISILCDKLLLLLSAPFTINNRQHYVTASIGIALYPDDAETAEQLILKSDMAMYQAKQIGKNTYQFYNAKLEKQAFLQVKIERELREALLADELEPYFQPKIDLLSGEIVGAEILMRWFKEDGSSIPPDIFIPIAESTGLICSIGKKAIKTAVEYLEQWHAQGISHLKLAVNLSIIEFQDPDVIQFILDTVDASDVSGSSLIIELTESIFMENKDTVSRTMEELRTRGISFALDDFGKGYSSFSYLQILPIDYLKIDKSFLQGVSSNKQSAAIARTIIDVGHNLELNVIAEGIEDQETLDYVIKEKCETAQGFFLHKPMNGPKYNQLIKEKCSNYNVVKDVK